MPGDRDASPGEPSGREAWAIALGILVLVLLATLLVDLDMVTVRTGSPDGGLPVVVLPQHAD